MQSISTIRAIACAALVMFAAAGAHAQNQKKAFDGYDSWRGALGASVATDPATLKVLPGFKAELIRSALPQEGSWVSLTFDPRGRIIIGRERGGILRLTPPGQGHPQVKVESINTTIREPRGLLYAFNSLYVHANGDGPQGRGLYRLRDTNGDDTFDEVKLLHHIDGGEGHGANGLALGPDGKSIYVINGNDIRVPTGPDVRLTHHNWAEDLLLPRQWEPRGHARGVLAPGGYAVRTDPDGKTWDIIAGGFRNPYDIAFNAEGELFTFDADLEWDAGLPWYRPCRVNHIIPGGEFGWRSGAGKWPPYYADSLGSVVDVGLSSPTGVVFGDKAAFPPRFKRALFICDWAYGRVFAVHLTPNGSTYRGELELFVTGKPLNLTDIGIGPDGAMVFTTGGRNTQSGLYRIRYVGPPVADDSVGKAPTEAEVEAGIAWLVRRQLQELYDKRGSAVVDEAWAHLGSPDRYIRFAARHVVENQDPALWAQRALDEKDPDASITALIALARTGGNDLQPRLLASLGRLNFDELSERQQLNLLRAYSLAFVRMGRPNADTIAAVTARLDPHYPAAGDELNRELCRVLAYLEAPSVVAKTMDLLAKARSQAQQVHYAYVLRSVKTGWTLDQRRAYFQWFNRARDWRGSLSFGLYIKNIRADALALLSDDERAALTPVLAAKSAPPVDAAESTAGLKFVKHWEIDELATVLDQVGKGRSFAAGRKAFADAQCIRCHRVGDNATATSGVGPDLTGVAGRFGRRDILVSIMLPSRVVDEKYRDTIFTLQNGASVVGTIAREDDRMLYIKPNPLAEQEMPVLKSDVRRTAPSPLSSMPTGLIDVLSKAQVLDLMAYLESAGNPKHPAFGK